MEQKIHLTSREQKLEWILIGIAVITALIIIKGIINQISNIDQDSVLTPLFFLLGSGFFILYGLNGIKKGQLTEKWTPILLRKWMNLFAWLIFKIAKVKDEDNWKVILGIFAISFGLISLYAAVGAIIS
jgi:hypothetical protein